MDGVLLKTENLSVAYEEEIALSDVSFEMTDGEILCIVGESGSGKSTLIKAIHGMNPLNIRNGRILFEGCDLTALSKADRRKRMGTEIALIQQDTGASFNPIRRLNVQFKEALTSHGMPYDEDRIADMLGRIGLKDGKALLKNRPYELSGGMLQRIAITAAMLFEPKLLLCDEATSALDTTTAGTVVNELLKIRDTNNTAILMVTHHLGIAKQMADHIGIMKEGRLIEYGEREKIFESPEQDYTKQLMKDVPRLKK